MKDALKHAPSLPCSPLCSHEVHDEQVKYSLREFLAGPMVRILSFSLLRAQGSIPGQELRSHWPHDAAKTKTNLFWDCHKAKLFYEVSEGLPLITSISWISKGLCWYLSACPCLSLDSPGSRSWDKDLNARGFLWQVTPGTPVEEQAVEARKGRSW